MQHTTLEPRWQMIGRFITLRLGWLAASFFSIWALAALYFDLRHRSAAIAATIIFAAALLAVLFLVKGSWARLVAYVGCCSIVLIWWLSLNPSNSGPWEEDHSQLASAEIHGDQIVIHNLRNCKYRSELDYSDCYEDRTVYLSQLRAVDLFLTNWGIKWISHPILSFQFGDNQHLAFSIEARYRPGQTYSTVRGFFRQYSLIIVPADERDVIRLRTNFRKDEEVYMYRLQLEPDAERAMFLTYVDYLNKLKDHPEWYNAVTRNCTSAIDKPLANATGGYKGWSIHLLLNGSMDELMYNRGRLVTGGLPFSELKAQAHINPVAHTAGESADFSKLIRAGRVGF